MSPAPALAVDLGGTKIAAGMVLPDHGIAGVRTVPTPADRGPDAVVSAVVELLRAVYHDSRVHETPIGIGVGSAGIVDPATGRIRAATDAIAGWAGTPLGDRIEQAFGWPVFVLNDVHAHALGEAVVGAGQTTGSMLLIVVGTGIGGALVVDGQVLSGTHHIAGHLGHVAVPEAEGLACPCGRDGHLEALASGPGMLAALRRAGGTAAEPREVVAMAEGGDERAHTVLATCGFAIGRVIGGLLNVLDPEVVVLTGGMAGAGRRWWDAVGDGTGHDAMDAVANTPIVHATAGNDAALIGAAQALRTQREKPTMDRALWL